MRRYRIVLGAIVVALSTSGCWFQVGFDPAHTNFNPNETKISSSNVAQLHLAWKTTVGTGASDPVIYGSRLIFTSSVDDPFQSGYVTELSANNGSQLWQKTVEGSAGHYCGCLGDPAINGSYVIVPMAGGGIGALFSYDLTTGASTGGGFETLKDYGGPPVVYDGNVAVLVASFDGSSTETFVQAGSQRDFLGANSGFVPVFASSPTVLGDHLYVTVGTRLLSFPLNSCTPSPSDATMCAPDWTKDFGSDTSAPVGAGTNHIAVGLANGNVAVVDNLGSDLWTDTTGSTNAGAPAVTDGKLFVTTDDHLVHEFTNTCGSSSCAEIGSVNVNLPIVGQPLVAGDTVYVGTTMGTVEAFTAGPCTSCPPLFTAAVDSTATSVRVIVDGGTLYATTSAGTVAAYRL